MQTQLSRVIVAVAVIITLVGAVGIVGADMNTSASDAPMNSSGDAVSHVADDMTAMGEMAHISEHMIGPMTEHMNNHEPGMHHDGTHHSSDHGHNSSHGHC